MEGTASGALRGRTHRKHEPEHPKRRRGFAVPHSAVAAAQTPPAGLMLNRHAFPTSLKSKTPETKGFRAFSMPPEGLEPST